MTIASLLTEQQASQTLLVSLTDRFQRYVEEFGYPTGIACHYCGKQVYAPLKLFAQIAAAPTGSKMGHDECHLMAGLNDKIHQLEADLVAKIQGEKLALVPKPEESRASA